MPSAIPGIFNMRVNFTGTIPPIPAFAAKAADTEDGGMFLPDAGFAPDHDTTFVREYQIEGSATVREMHRQVIGASTSTPIYVAGYRTDRSHDMSGLGRWRIRDTVDGVVGDWSGWAYFLSTNPAPVSLTTLDPWGSGYHTTTLDTAYPTMQVKIGDAGHFVYYVKVGAGTCTINSRSPAYDGTDHGSGVNIGADENAFINWGTVGPLRTQPTYPLTLSPGDIWIGARTDYDNSEDVEGSDSAQRVKTLTCIIPVEEFPPADMFAPAPYSGNGRGWMGPQIWHKNLIDLAKVYFPGAPTYPEAERNQFFTNRLSKFAPFFRTSSTPTRGLCPDLHATGYHRETIGELHFGALCAMGNYPEAERRRFAEALVQRTIYQMAHKRGTNDARWWEGPVAVAAALMNFNAWRSPYYYGVTQGPPYDATVSEEDSDSNLLGRYATSEDMGLGTPLKTGWQAFDDPITWTALQSDRVVSFTPSSSFYAIRLADVEDLGDGTYRIPAGLNAFGMRASYNRTFFFDPRPTASGGLPFANVAWVPGGNYREEWVNPIDGNSPYKEHRYGYQHAQQMAITWLETLALFGDERYSEVRHMEIFSEDYMGLSREWVDLISGYPRSNGDGTGDPIYGVYPPPATEQSFTHVTWWASRDAAKTAGPLAPANVVPSKLERSKFVVRDAGDGTSAFLRLIGLPESDGNSRISEWQFKIDEGSPVTVSGSRLNSETKTSLFTYETPAIVSVRMNNATGWSDWSDGKSFTPVGPSARVVASQQMTLNSTATTYTGGAYWDGIDEDAIGDMAILFLTRGTTTVDIATAGAGDLFTKVYWTVGNQPRYLNVAYRIITADDVAATVAGRMTRGLSSPTNFVRWSVQTMRLRSLTGGTLSIGTPARTSQGGQGPEITGLPMPALTGLQARDLLIYGAAYGSGVPLAWNGTSLSSVPAVEGCWSAPPATDARTGLLVRPHPTGSTAVTFKSTDLGYAACDTFGFAVRAAI